MTVHAETEAEILRMFDEGAHRNEIARALGLAGSTVSRVCAEHHRSFDRAELEARVRASQIDLEESRKALVQRMLLEARNVLNSLDEPHLVYSFGGRENTYAEHVLDAAPLSARLDAIRLAGTAFDKATRLVERSNPGFDEAVGVLDSLAAGFKAAAAQIRADEDREDDVGAF